ncbi:MAG: diadenylate cyclase [Kiritimatiellae bacterium]|nr:diadenylate cyclase [Kiritimatiellia bacterium]
MLEGFQIGIGDVVQVTILTVVIYLTLDLIRGTRAGQVLWGFLKFIFLPGFFVWLFNWEVLGRIYFWLMVALAVSMIVVFQEEIRRAFALIGGGRLFGVLIGKQRELVPDTLIKSIRFLANQRLGALIAVERGISLAGYEESGIRLDAIISRELLVSIFTPPLPLHDGGIIIRNGLISAAHCIFPVSNREELISSGMRHRAAVGLSEESDAVVLVVSEERGTVSVAYNGELKRYRAEDTDKAVRNWIKTAMTNQNKRPFNVWEWTYSKYSTLRQKLRTFFAKKGGAK